MLLATLLNVKLPEEDRDVFFGGDVEETGLTDTDDTKSKFPPAPKLILTLRDKVNFVVMCCVVIVRN